MAVMIKYKVSYRGRKSVTVESETPMRALFKVWHEGLLDEVVKSDLSFHAMCRNSTAVPKDTPQ